jgi:hypothetical protein
MEKYINKFQQKKIMNLKKSILFILVFIFLSINVFSVGTPPNASNAVASYGFNDGSLNDLTPNNNTLINNGATNTSSCIFSNCYSFDGTSNDMHTNNSTPFNFGTGDFSFSIWIKPTAGTSNNAYIISKGAAYNHNGLALRYNAGDVYMYFETTSTYFSSTKIAVNVGAWNHIVMTRNSGNVTLYVNGVNSDSITWTNSVSNNVQLFLGSFDPALGSNSGYFYKGLIDEINIFNSSISSSTVSYLYTNGNPNNAQQYNYTQNSLTFENVKGNNQILNNLNVFNTTSITFNGFVNVTNSTSTNINVSYSLDNSTYTQVSTNNQSFNFQISQLTQGNHIISFYATNGLISTTLNKTFDIQTYTSPPSTILKQILYYDYETGSGSLALDKSGNNYNAILQGATFDDLNSKFGSYSLQFDGVSSYTQTNSEKFLYNDTTFSFWSYPSSSWGNQQRPFFNLNDATYNYFKFSYDNQNKQFIIKYLNTTYNEKIRIIANKTLTFDTWHYFNLQITNDSIITLYVDNNKEGSINISNIYEPSTSTLLEIGRNIDSNRFYYGNLDSFRIFAFNSNSSQMNDLYFNDIIDLQYNAPLPKPQNITGIQQTAILTSLNPQNNSNVDNSITITGTTNHKANCEIYIDNSIDKIFNDTTSFSYQRYFSQGGKHNYFVYCDYVYNTTKRYEISPIRYFNVNLINSGVHFYFYQNGTNTLISNKNYNTLYLSTPCLNGSQAFGNGVLINGKNLNKLVHDTTGNVYIKKVNNGLVDFSLLGGRKYDFCLINGNLQLKDNHFSNNYTIQTITYEKPLGKLFVNNNQTQNSYEIYLQQSDLYNYTNPSHYGYTWLAVFTAFLLFIIGLMVMLAGIKEGNGKIVLVGGVIMLSAFGISFGSFIFGSII